MLEKFYNMTFCIFYRIKVVRSDEMIEIKDLTKKYGNHVAVDHISLTVSSGRIYGFLGPNGAGKSTTMNMITVYL